MGRKKLPPGEGKETYLPKVRISPAELAVVRAAAEAAGEGFSDWARTVLVRAARRSERASGGDGVPLVGKTIKAGAANRPSRSVGPRGARASKPAS